MGSSLVMTPEVAITLSIHPIKTMAKENLFLCMGSACHQMGVYDVLPKLQALIKEHNLEDAVELKGSFCLETCSQGIVMKFQENRFFKISPQNVETIFTEKILPVIQDALAHAS
jgi:NADH:ubiquinone oxidoreductase subunit E